MNNQIGKFKVQVVDLVEGVCEICGKDIYPSIMCKLEGKWGNKYVCEACIMDQGVVSKEKLDKTCKSYTKNKGSNIHVDKSWLNIEEIAELMEVFLGIEEEDMKYIRGDTGVDIFKIHRLRHSLNIGKLIYSEEELVDYLNLYGNNIDVVMTLRTLMMRNPKNEFIMQTYIDSRVRKLSNAQVDALKREKSFKFISEDLEEFWLKFEDLNKKITEERGQEEYSPEYAKITSIVDSVVTHGFYTKDQRYVLDNYLKDK